MPAKGRRMSEHHGIKLIREYEAGKKGYAIRGDTKAFMYVRLLDCEDEQSAFRCFQEFDNGCFIAYAHFHAEKDLPYCWVSQKGDIYYCDIGAHDRIVRNVFRQEEAEFEKTHAKISIHTYHNGADPMQYVKRPSKIMKRVVHDVLYGRFKEQNQ